MTADRVAKLRQLMEEVGVDGYVVPSEDSHQSEYPLSPDRRREFISGFTGSAGYALITKDQAFLWTDGRYFLQAETELDDGVWTLCKQGTPGCPTFSEVVKNNVTILGFDPFVHSKRWVDDITKALTGSGSSILPVHKKTTKGAAEAKDQKVDAKHPAVREIHSGQRNLVDEVWQSAGRPPYPSNTIVDFDNCGKSVPEKLDAVCAQMTNEEVMVLANLSQIAWLLNLRGADVDCSRIFLAYCVIFKTPGADGLRATLYLKNSTAANRIEPAAVARLSKCGVKVEEYEAIFANLSAVLQEKLKGGSAGVWVADDVNVGLLWLVESTVSGLPVKVAKSPVDLMKAVKNEVELEGMRRAHMEDGFALSQVLCYLETATDLSRETECTIAAKLEERRASRPTYECLSFDSIVGVGENGAIIHYRPEEKTCKKVYDGGVGGGMILIDSGAHYTGGTTDVTRTIYVGGKPSAMEKELYTRVLMGHLDLAAAIFPVKTNGCMLDCLARRHLWEVGLNFLHGTGHGVGHSLEVHEAPPNIAYACPPSERDVHFEPGMVVSNEPGVYLDGKFGIRIESLIYCHTVKTNHQFNQTSPYLGFTDLTKVPYARKLIDQNLLTEKQRRQLDAYHQDVKEILTFYALKETQWGLVSKEQFLRWLDDACAPL